MVQVRNAFKLLAPNEAIGNALVQELQPYISRTGEDFGDVEFIKEGKRIHPVLWWSMVSTSTHLSELACRIFRMPASAAGGMSLFLSGLLYSRIS